MTKHTLSRRSILAWLGIGAALPALTALGASPALAKTWRVSYPDAEWRKRLGKEAYDVLRKHGTERAFTSPLDKEKRKGTFTCKGCGNDLY
ncbi:MAG: peptide-methionine (R)-S-oxide reductase, partial [Proteobacteria bacterium]